MGVSGSGKSAVGRALAARLGWPMLEGDLFHPPANVAKMSWGEPLDDADRGPWLDALTAAMRQHRDCVVTCSALKQRYRDKLRVVGDTRFVHLAVDHDVLMQRLGIRTDHFFNPALLDSQLAAMEPPDADEAVTLAVDAPPQTMARRVAEALGLE